MIFQPFYRFDTGCAAYVFGCVGEEQCVIFDPRIEDVDKYLEFAKMKEVNVTYVIDSHVHADHVSGGPEIAKRTGAEYCLHESAEVSHPFRKLKDGEELQIGKVKAKVLHTP